MRYVTKGRQPKELIEWKALNTSTPQNLVYGGSFPAEEVRRTMLAEQFHLCAYTLVQLKTAVECQDNTTISCHVEHLLPQSRKIAGEDIDYQNMVACFPPSKSQVACEFGAKFKDDFDLTTGRYIDRRRMTSEKQKIEVLAQAGGFISPLSTTVGSHIDFDGLGNVKALTASGETTIGVLNLNHKTLVNDRAAVIRGYLQPRGKKISAQSARRLAQDIRQPDARRCLPAFCVAIAQVALDHADREEGRAARLKKKATP